MLNVEVDLFQPCLNIKARTTFANPGEVTVTDDLGFGIVYGKALQKLYHTAVLGFCSSVGRIAFLIETALVTYAYAVGVVMLGMGSYHFLRTARVDFAILRNVIVVADGLEATSLVAGFQSFYREVLIHTGR